MSGQSLLERLKADYHSRVNDPDLNRFSDRVTTLFYWFISTTQIYVTVTYLVPTYFGDCNEWVPYYLKVLSWFVFIQVTANWACVRRYDAIYKPSNDHAELRMNVKEKYNCYMNEMQSTKSSQKFDCAVDMRNKSVANGGTNCNGHVSYSAKTSLHRINEERLQIEDDDESKQNSKSTEKERKDNISKLLHWWWCDSCKRMSPPRSHHCVMCHACILKRDHHCYLTGVCVGYNNQRYFIVMCAYMTLSCSVGIYFTTMYLHENFWPNATFSDCILPVTCYRWLIHGSVELHHLFMIFHVYTFWWIGLMASGFFSMNMGLILLGKTSFEFRQKIKIRSTSSVAENFRSVFGNFWPINFILPAQILFRQLDDGTNWNNLKPS